MLEVLLFSPLRDRDPPSGDVAYTESLLASPPPGVRYTTYAEALVSGKVTLRGRSPRHASWRAADGPVSALRVVERVLRGRLMFREPIWFVSIEPGAFDLVHQHVFPVRQVGPTVRTVSSAGYPLPFVYRERERWSEGRLSVATKLERCASRALGVQNPWLWCTHDNVMTVYTERFREWLVADGIDPRRVTVSGTAVPPVSLRRHVTHCRTLGFIGRDFERKGGDVAVQAFERLRRTHPHLRMLLLTSGSAPLPDSFAVRGIDVVRDAVRESVLNEHLPRVDVLLLPTKSDCGAPFGMLEAMQAGIPVVTSDFPWLDQRLRPPGVIRTRAEPAAVAAAVEQLLDVERLSEASNGAARLWQDEFSMPALHQSLIAAYELALGRRLTIPEGSQ